MQRKIDVPLAVLDYHLTTNVRVPIARTKHAKQQTMEAGLGSVSVLLWYCFRWFPFIPLRSMFRV